MIVKMTKLSDNENKWVDETGVKNGILGYLKEEPKIGMALTLWYADHMDSAYLNITRIKHMEFFENTWIVTTINSQYKIEKISD